METVSYVSVYEIINKRLGFNKVQAQQILKQLTDQHILVTTLWTVLSS